MSARAKSYPVTDEIRRAVADPDIRRRIVAATGISYRDVTTLNGTFPTTSALVPAIAEALGLPVPEPVDVKAGRHTKTDAKRDEPKERIATGAESFPVQALVLELAARGVIEAGKLRLPVLEPENIPRPKTRADCERGPRPCPWWRCRFHLWRTDSVDRAGRRHYAGGDAGDEVRPTGVESCALDTADLGEHSRDDVAERMGLRKERVRQIEEETVSHVKRLLVARGVDGPSAANQNSETYSLRLKGPK